jgi:transposase
MLGKTPRQGSFWDTEWIEHLIDEDSFEWHFKRVVRPLISDEDFAWAYSPDRGRIAIPPSLIACSLILQQRYRLSDRDMEKQIRFNLATKYALGLPMDDEGFDHTVLCKFRGMLVENDQAKVCFDRFRGALIEAGLIRSGEAAVIDTTHVIADIAIPNTIELLRMGIKGVLRSAERIPAGVGNQLAKNLELGVVFEPARRGEEKERLVELVHAARRLISYLEKSGDASHPGMKESVDQLKRILQENTRERVEKRGRGERVVIDEREGPYPDRLVSTVDPDARHGRKSEDKKFTGYKAQIVESEAGFITAIDGMLGNRHDTWGVGDLVADLGGVGIKPSWLVGDKAYGNEELGSGLERGGVRVVTPLKDHGDGVFPNDLFEYIYEEGKVPRLRCPAGEETEMRDRLWMGRRFCFTGCGLCPLKQRCTAMENRSVTISPSYFFRKRKAAFNGTAAYKDLMRERAKIERKNGQLKNGFGFRRCRYRGLAKFRFQCFFSALAANIQRLVSIFITAPPGNPALAAIYA